MLLDTCMELSEGLFLNPSLERGFPLLLHLDRNCWKFNDLCKHKGLSTDAHDTGKLIVHIIRVPLLQGYFQGFPDNPEICTFNQVFIAKTQSGVKGSSPQGAISANMDNMNYLYCRFHFIWALTGADGSLLPTMSSGASCASRKIESLSKIPLETSPSQSICCIHC